jgi:hypothetical protein
MRDRQLLLQASFFGKFHNSNDATNPAVQLYWRALHAIRPKKSCLNAYLDNTGFQKVIPKRNHLVDRLVKENPTLMPAELMTAKVREFTRTEGIKTLEIQESNIAMVLGEVWKEETRFILRTTTIIPKAKSDIVKWLIGNICTHTICRKCGQEVSRNHGIQCAGVELWVMHIFPNAYEQLEGRTEDSKRESVLDIILRANKQNRDVRILRVDFNIYSENTSKSNISVLFIGSEDDVQNRLSLTVFRPPLPFLLEAVCCHYKLELDQTISYFLKIILCNGKVDNFF